MRSLRAVCLAACVLACTSPRTEIVVQIVTDLPTGPGAALQSLAVEVRSGGATGELRLQHHAVLGGGEGEWTLPSSIGLLPKDGETGGAVWIAVSGCAARVACDATTALVVQRAVVSYVRDATYVIDLVLASRCAGVRCALDQTCSPVTGACVSASRQSELRPLTDAAAPPPDAAPDVAVAPDAPTAPVSRSCVGGAVGCGLVAMEGGAFAMGSAAACTSKQSTAEACALRASPPSPMVRVDPFWLDAYEVSVARFRRFWAERSRDGGASTRARPVAYPGGRTVAWPAEAPAGPSTMVGCTWASTAGAGESLPIDCLSYWLAMEFCAWDGGRLPTEAEWEYAARWRPVPAESLAPGRWYPWGEARPSNECDRARWNVSNSPGCMRWGNGTAPVGSFSPTGGVYDLAGNVAELTADRETPFGQGCWASGGANPLCGVTAGAVTAADERVISRGGGWNALTPAWLRTPSRRGLSLTLAHLGVGFRCARSR
jgi:formylglycine-generating enzyme required for sulfatase activity